MIHRYDPMLLVVSSVLMSQQYMVQKVSANTLKTKVRLDLFLNHSRPISVSRGLEESNPMYTQGAVIQFWLIQHWDNFREHNFSEQESSVHIYGYP